MCLKLKTKGEEGRLRKEESSEKKKDEENSAGAESRNVEEGEWMMVVESVEVKLGWGVTYEKRKTDSEIGKGRHSVLLSFCCG